MSTVIVANQLGTLKNALDRVHGPIRYLDLIDSPNSHAICDYLCKRANTHELPRAELYRKHGASFRDQYIEFMGKLNRSNHSLYWWALPFTDKHALLRSSFRDISYFLLVVELARSGSATLLVITDSDNLSGQIKVWGESEGIKTVDIVRKPWSWPIIFKKYTPAGIFNVAFRTFVLWTACRGFRPKPDYEKGFVVLATLTHPRSFTTNNTYQDAYFGPLVGYLTASEQPFLILGLLVEQPLKQIKKLKIQDFGLQIVPLESYLDFKDIVACTVRSLIRYLNPTKGIQSPMKLGNLDLTYVVKRAIEETCHSGNLFMSLRVYYAAKRLAETIRVTRCIYPYENRSWEKMLLLGIQQVSPETKMVGYQHASVSASHTNFVLHRDEADITPLPDRLLTTGELVKTWLEINGNYPPGILKTACALRQSQTSTLTISPRRPNLENILVALATNTEEYVKILSFLEQAFPPDTIYNLRVRPHPAFSLELALNSTNLGRQDFFSPSTGPLEEDLKWADLVIYASSTVGLEAIALGLPAIHLELGDLTETDPIIGWDAFKWSVQSPSDLINTIERITAIPDAQFQELQQRGQTYINSYLSPVTDAALSRFCEV